MKRLIIILAMCTIWVVSFAQTLQNPAIIGASSRNQKIVKSLIVGDSLIAGRTSVLNLQLRNMSAGSIPTIGADSTLQACGATCDNLLALINYSIPYDTAQARIDSNALVPQATYYINDKNVFIIAASDSTFRLVGFEPDTITGEIYSIQYDFVNAHIQQRCDKRGNCVGATFDYVDAGLVSVDPISVFLWGDQSVQGNYVRNAVFNISALGAPYYFVVGNTITNLAEWEVSNSDSITLQNNTISNQATWTSLNSDGLYFENDFKNDIAINTDSASLQMQSNQMSGASNYVRLNRSQGNFLSNIGQGHISCTGCTNYNIRSTSLFDGAYIYADSMTADINANELHRGSELHMVRADSAFSKNYFDFTAIVHADENHNRSEYNRFIGCGNGFGTNFYVAMTTSGQINGYSIFSCDTVTLNDATTYNQGALDTRANIRYTGLPDYVDDAAADADTNLLSGSLYLITGDRTIYLKP